MKESGWTVSLVLAGLFGAFWIGLAARTGYGTASLGVAFGLVIGACFRVFGGARQMAIVASVAGLLTVSVAFTAACVAPSREQPKTSVEEQITDEAMVVSTAQQIAEEWTMEGREMAWPAGHSAATAAETDHFPPQLWQAALRQWQLTPPAVKARCRECRKANLLRSREDSAGYDVGWVLAGLGWSALAGIVAVATCIIGTE